MTRRVLTGMRTTGKLHLGHYVGALERWKEIQDLKDYECFFLLADTQALTTHSENPELLIESVRDVVLDWLSVGLDPGLPHVHFVQQSQVTERYELSGLLMMIAKYAEVMRNPTLKSELEGQESATMGFMSYPVDQAADIYMVSPTPFQRNDELLVPVGEDQVPHLEYSKVLAQRFNKMYCSDRKKSKVFVPCTALVGRVGRLVGIDGQSKMSKSLNNAIYLADDATTVTAKVRRMFTDPNRTRPYIPGNTDDTNPVFMYHRAFNPNKLEVDDLTSRYQQGKVGDVEVKQLLAKAINAFLDPIREKRSKFENTDISEIVIAGTEVAKLACKPVIEAVRERMSLVYPK